jgi:hypothetical protein
MNSRGAALVAMVAAMLVASCPSSAVAEGRDFVEPRWGAIAVAFWRDQGGTNRVASGAAVKRATESDAVNAALGTCRSNGGQNCRIIGSALTGCAYIAVGRRGSRVRYGTGESPKAAADQCRLGGFRCSDPAGGCSN